MADLLCATARCRHRGWHVNTCTDEHCRGCQRWPAADGLRLCARHTDWLAEDATAAADLYHALEAVLVGGPSTTEPVSGSPSATLRLNLAAVDARATIRAVLVSWALLVADERGIATPEDHPSAIGAYLARHSPWLAAHPAAGDASDELHELAHGRNRGIAYPNPSHTADIGPCPQPDCDGRLVARIRDRDALLPSAITCTEQPDHTWPAGQWHLIPPLLDRAKVTA